MENKSFESRLQRARENVSAMDKIDGRKDRYIGTILAALECGLKRPETNAQFEALAMLQDHVKEGGNLR